MPWQLDDGSLLLNARDLSGARRRFLQRSSDLGTLWSEPWRVDALAEPPPRGCHGSMVGGTLSQGEDAPQQAPLFFSHPASAQGRERLTIHRSDDEGVTWDRQMLVHAGPAAYSSMQILPNGTLAILYERGETPAAFFAQRIVFELFKLSAASALGGIELPNGRVPTSSQK